MFASPKTAFSFEGLFRCPKKLVGVICRTLADQFLGFEDDQFLFCKSTTNQLAGAVPGAAPGGGARELGGTEGEGSGISGEGKGAAVARRCVHGGLHMA